MTDWTRARCLAADPDMFHPPLGETFMAAAAKQVCAGCPIRVECLQLALDTQERHGVWGGLSPAERHRLARRAA